MNVLTALHVGLYLHLSDICIQRVEDHGITQNWSKYYIEFLNCSSRIGNNILAQRQDFSTICWRGGGQTEWIVNSKLQLKHKQCSASDPGLPVWSVLPNLTIAQFSLLYCY